MLDRLPVISPDYLMWFGVVGLIIIGALYMSPGQRLIRKLNRVWDGAGVTRTEYREKDGKTRSVHHRPRVFRRKRIDQGLTSFLVRPNPGKTVEDIVDCGGAIRDALKASEVKVAPQGRGIARVEVYTRDAIHAAYSSDEIASRTDSEGKLFIGVQDSGVPVDLNLGHTLIVGATGSGKGSALWRYIMSLERELGSNGIQFWGIDPKRAELASVGDAFERVAYDPIDIQELLGHLVDTMKSRQSEGRRAFVQTADRPLIVLVIDEFNSLSMMSDRIWQSSVKSSLQQLLSQGRSAGIYVVAAAQQPQKESLGPYRPHFMNRICLRVESAQEVDMVLGAGSAELGANAHEIPPATETNGYRTAGVGYVRTDSEPAPVRIRTPFVSDDDIDRWLEAFRRDY